MSVKLQKTPVKINMFQIYAPIFTSSEDTDLIGINNF